MKILTLLTVFLLLSLSSFAGVNLKNGNFYISYADIIVPGGAQDLEVTKTFNSYATKIGKFGFGWGCWLDTYLEAAADGSVIVHENGSGSETRFTPREQIDPTKAAQRIVKAMKKRATVSDKTARALIAKLKKNADLRQMYARRFNIKVKLAKGTILYSNIRGLQQVHKLAKGYKRSFNDGKLEFYNEAGQLYKTKDKNGYTINLNYKKGVLLSVKDSEAKQLFFAWYPDGKIKNIWSAGDKKTFYKYDNNHNLIASKDVSNNHYKYSYDNNHNMTEIAYSDKTKMKVAYNNSSWVSKITSRDGEITQYSYGANPKNPDLHYWTSVTRQEPGEESVKERYEYESKVKKDGSQYVHRIATEVDGLKTETVYSECCGLPEKIKRGKHVTNFEYNKLGLLTKKQSSKGDFVKLSYHKKLNKITRVVNNDGWTNFEYDKKGNLNQAQSSKGKSVLLIYNSKGLITKMIDRQKKSKKKRSLTFKYNAMDKPVEIAMQNVGKINVAYDNYGEIKKVESKAGHNMALQVTDAFQSLLAIVKPAGVDLNM